MRQKKKISVCIAALMIMASIPAFAQEESGEDQLSNGFKKFNVREDLAEGRISRN